MLIHARTHLRGLLTTLIIMAASKFGLSCPGRLTQERLETNKVQLLLPCALEANPQHAT